LLFYILPKEKRREEKKRKEKKRKEKKRKEKKRKEKEKKSKNVKQNFHSSVGLLPNTITEHFLIVYSVYFIMFVRTINNCLLLMCSKLFDVARVVNM
jgi:hypothetical protein